MEPTNVENPDYYHKVVDCQWACPAHTNVPGYIRLIAQERYDDAYMLNWESNVFPGILGRTCDRPCEPACRRGRVEDKPVAICRLKRVAADLRGDITPRFPEIPKQKNGKRIACVGGGPASLTVARDLMPLGYEVTIFEKNDRPGGLMWTNIPQFRLPPEVLWEEIDYILDMGVDIRYNAPVKSMKWLLEQGFDAVFVGSGAPRGKELRLPGRYDTDRIYIGIDWLESVAFGHTNSIEENVLVIGVGNTAMDCCRTSKRIGGTNVKVMARKSKPYFKASPWELEDAEEELVDIVENHSPTEFVVEDGVLRGMNFDIVEWHENDQGRLVSTRLDQAFFPADAVILAIGQETAFPWIEDDAGIEFNKWREAVVDRTTFMSTREGVFFGGDAAWGPENIIWAAEHGHQAAISIHAYCSGEDIRKRPPEHMNLVSAKMGLHEWSYSNDYEYAARRKMRHVRLEERLQEHRDGGRGGVRPRADADRGRALPELRHSDALHGKPVHRVRRLHRHLSPQLPHDHAQRGGSGSPHAVARPRREHRAGHLRLRAAAADGPRHGEGRGSLHSLRAVRGALSDGGLGHADLRSAQAVRGTGRGPSLLRDGNRGDGAGRLHVGDSLTEWPT